MAGNGRQSSCGAYGKAECQKLYRCRPTFAPPGSAFWLTFVVVMKRHSLFRRFVSLLLAVLVLTTSVGLTVQRLTCRMSGRSTVALSVAGRADLQGCTADMTPAAPVAKDNCCDFSKQLHKLSTPAHELAAKVLVPVPMLVFLPPSVAWPKPLLATLPPASAPRWFAADSSPPPRGGRGLLVFACTLVV